MTIGLLILRLVFGLTMAAHGAQMLFGWFGGGGIAKGTVANTSVNGVAASNYGSGGSGANGNNVTTARPGGAGTAGLVIITEYHT